MTPSVKQFHKYVKCYKCGKVPLHCRKVLIWQHEIISNKRYLHTFRSTTWEQWRAMRIYSKNYLVWKLKIKHWKKVSWGILTMCLFKKKISWNHICIFEFILTYERISSNPILIFSNWRLEKSCYQTWNSSVTAWKGGQR